MKKKQHKNYLAIMILEAIAEKMDKPSMFDGEIWYELEDMIMEIVEEYNN